MLLQDNILFLPLNNTSAGHSSFYLLKTKNKDLSFSKRFISDFTTLHNTTKPSSIGDTTNYNVYKTCLLSAHNQVITKKTIETVIEPRLVIT